MVNFPTKNINEPNEFMSNAFMLNYAVNENFYDGDPSYTLIYNTTKSGAPCHPD